MRGMSGRTVPAWLSRAPGALGEVRSFLWEMPPGWRDLTKPGIMLKMWKHSIYVLLLLAMGVRLGRSQLESRSFHAFYGLE